MECRRSRPEHLDETCPNNIDTAHTVTPDQNLLPSLTGIDWRLFAEIKFEVHLPTQPIS
jgi:hypothetical protein